MDPIANELYRLYSNPTPYEVFPDVREFFHRMRGKPRENIKASKYIRGLKVCDMIFFFNSQIGALTNFDRRIYRVVEQLGLSNDLDFLVCSEDAKYIFALPRRRKKRRKNYFFFLRASKPSPAIFELALSSASAVLSSSDACHVGDDVDKDYLGARAAGFGRALLMDRSGGGESLEDGRVQEEDVCKDFLEVMEKLELPTR